MSFTTKPSGAPFIARAVHDDVAVPRWIDQAVTSHAMQMSAGIGRALLLLVALTLAGGCGGGTSGAANPDRAASVAR